jgi:hypothetical protein
VYNKNFKLDPNDIEIIEAALNAKLARRTNAAVLNPTVENRQKLLNEANEIRDLLGRLHHQKNWYRPKKGTYIGG